MIRELERLGLTVPLHEAKLKEEQDKQSLEHYQLDLIRDGKLCASSQHGLESGDRFDVSVNLNLRLLFWEEEMLFFFCSLRDLLKLERGQTERMLLLRCIFTGKAQEPAHF